MFENLPTEKEIDRGACIYELYRGMGRAGLSRRNVGLYILAPPKHKRSARVVEQVLIQLSGHYFSLRENHGQGWIIPT